MATSANHNEHKPRGPVRVGLIAAGERLATLAAAIDACVLIQPLGQSGMPQGAGMPDVAWYDDPRKLLTQPALEAVMLGTSTHGDSALAADAAERGLHVWRLPPLGRDFAEAADAVEHARRCTSIYRVASWWEYVADHVWRELRWPDNFTPLFSELRVSAGPAAPGARSPDSGWAAGGVLANDAYPLIEALVAVRGLPDTVSAVTGSYRTASSGLPQGIEDTAAAVLRYPEGAAAVIRATWAALPTEQLLQHHGRGALVTLTDEELTLADASGTIVDRRPLPGEFLASELLCFAELVRSQARDRAAAGLGRHLAVSALLDTVYLSARTGHPESPAKLYRVRGWPEPHP